LGRVRRLLKPTLNAVAQVASIVKNIDNSPPKSEFKMKDLAVGQKR